MKTDDLSSYSETGEALGVDRKTIADLVRFYGLKPKRMPRRANGKGLDSADRQFLRRVLKIRPKAESLSA